VEAAVVPVAVVPVVVVPIAEDLVVVDRGRIMVKVEIELEAKEARAVAHEIEVVITTIRLGGLGKILRREGVVALNMAQRII
jgi:hypothetical protein